jgi:hypothetical protein
MFSAGGEGVLGLHRRLVLVNVISDGGVVLLYLIWTVDVPIV